MTLGLVLNSCFFGFYAHFGFARELERAGVPIAAAAGSSAGAIVAAIVASGLGASRGLDMALSFTRDDFWDPEPLHRAVARLGLVRGERLERILEAHLPHARIEACPLPLVIAAVSVPPLVPRLLTEGPLARAVRASCAIPFVLQPVPLGG
ncbi:MAG: patatin-like phospholipase family protein, partial [Planctomycetota bacterium]